MLLAMVLSTACTDDDNEGGSSPSAAVDAGPAFTEKAVDVNRDGKAFGQVTLRFYADMPNVPYISMADFHRLMTGGETMKVQRQGSLYELTTRDGTATVDVLNDNLRSTAYANFVNLMWMVDASLAPNTMHDGSRYLKFLKMEYPSAFKPASVTQLDFKRYEIDLHDDGTNVYCPFATLADMYSDCNFHYAACHDDKVMMSTALDTYMMNTLDPDYAAKPYQQATVTADMAKYRYQELCFVFDNLFGYPGRSPMEQNGMGEKGFDATLDVVENGPAVKRLLQSTNNMDFAWGRMALQYLVHDGGHTNVRATAGVPASIRDEYAQRVLAVMTNYPEAAALYAKNVKEMDERSKVMTQLNELRRQAYGDVLYKANSQKTLGVIIINSFADQDDEAWKKYYASPKGNADWEELMKNYQKDNHIAFLYALGQAKKDGVKNLVLDITQNSGGSCDIVAATVSMLRKNRTVQFWSQDALEGTNKIATYQLDTNFDGVFDERDDTNPKFDCSDMNIAVLSSWLSFSCAHQFTTLMKDYDFPVIGEHSGGGTCCIQVMLTPDGQHYMISTYRDRSTDKNFANTDSGIPTTDGYAFDYAHFYDLDFLTTKMQELYK